MADQPNQPEAQSPEQGARRRSRRRSPNYPYIDLEAAMQRARQLYEQEQRHSAPWNAVAQHWGYSATSSSMDKVAAALGAYGLVNLTGTGDDRHIQLTERSLDIIEDERPESPERRKAIQEAALSPTIHRELRDQYGTNLPSDATLRTYLIRQRDFNPNVVGSVIATYRSTIQYADLDSATSVPDNHGDEHDIEVGDYVQWNSGGVAQFPNPLKVVKIEPHGEDGAYALVEGSNTAVRVDELVRVEGYVPPPPGSSKLRMSPKEPGMKQDVYGLDEGDVVLQWPARLSQKSFEEISDWFELIKRKLSRSIQPESEPARAADSQDNSNA